MDFYAINCSLSSGKGDVGIFDKMQWEKMARQTLGEKPATVNRLKDSAQSRSHQNSFYRNCTHKMFNHPPFFFLFLILSLSPFLRNSRKRMLSLSPTHYSN